jgi:hypothetical protein
MKEISELNHKNYKTNPNIDKNLDILFQRLNEFQDAIGFELKITSGLRSEQLQQDLILAGKTNAVHSKHLAGAAADVQDRDGKIGEYILANTKLLEVIGLWCEHPNKTKGWVHFQISGPKSGKRIFMP